MLKNKPSLGVYFMGRFNSKVVYQNMCFLQVLETNTR